MKKKQIMYLKTEKMIFRNFYYCKTIIFPNVIVTSHQGFLTNEALESISITTFENAMSYLNGNLIENNVVM